MLFDRKVIVIALMAVVLLGTSVDGKEGVDGLKRRHRPRTTAGAEMSFVDPTLQQGTDVDLDGIRSGWPIKAPPKL